jgi:ATP-dependent 26S proteasome regulatory subunit
MSTTAKIIESTATALMDPAVPLPHRKLLLGQLCMDQSPPSGKIVERLLAAAAEGKGEALFAKKVQELNELLEELRSGPLRKATFLGLIATHRPAVNRAHVLFENGDSAYPVIADADLAESLAKGDGVLLDLQARSLLCRDPHEAPVGEVGRFERSLDGRVEVVLREQEKFVFRVSSALRAKIERGEVKPGAKLLLCARRAMAFDSLPEPDGLAHYRFLVREKPPDVSLARDVGNPPRFIEELLEHVRTEMERPELGRRYRLTRARTKLLSGVTGAGKTLSIHAFWRAVYELLAALTGVPADDLPPRVFRLRMPEVLSKWLGESDQNLDRFFDEIEQLGRERFKGPDGREFELPVLVICEEIDGLARSRGGDPIYDRIQTTALERLDLNCQKLRDRLIIFIFTTNVPHLVDPAFLRRAGGTWEHFGRLGRRAFESVLEKHLSGLPFPPAYAADGRKPERRTVREVSDWLYSTNGHDPGQVQLTFVGSSTPQVKHRRDFLTGALVQRAVQQAAAAACRAERLGEGEPGVSTPLLLRAFSAQIRSLVAVLTPQNAGDYVTLPDGARVGEVRRIEEPLALPYELERDLTDHRR